MEEKTYYYGVVGKGGQPIADQDLHPDIKGDIDAFELRGLGGPAQALIESLMRFQEMRVSGEFCCLNIVSDYDHVWGVTYARDRLLDDDEGAHQIRAAGSFNYYTLIEAVDAAYSMWKGGQLE